MLLCNDAGLRTLRIYCIRMKYKYLDHFTSRQEESSLNVMQPEQLVQQVVSAIMAKESVPLLCQTHACKNWMKPSISISTLFSVIIDAIIREQPPLT